MNRSLLIRSILVIAFVSLLHAHSIPHAYASQRLVSLAPNITEILYALSLHDDVVGITDFCDFPAQVKTKQRIGGLISPSCEKVMFLDPDIVILTPEGNTWGTYKKLLDLNIKVFIFDPKTIKNLPSAIEELGMALNAKTEAKELSQKLRNRIETMTLRSQKKKQLSAVFIVQLEPLIVAGAGTHIEEALAILNIRNIASAGKYPRFSAEVILREKPNLILVAPHSGKATSLEKLQNSGSRIIKVDERFLRLSPRIIEALEELENTTIER